MSAGKSGAGDRFKNFTDLVEKQNCSESYWTTLASLFFRYLECTPGLDFKKFAPRVWKILVPATNNKYYGISRSWDTHFDEIGIEPNRLKVFCKSIGIAFTPKTGGFSPDIVIRRDNYGRDSLIECKVNGHAKLKDGQMENYPAFIQHAKGKIPDKVEMLLLISLGANEGLVNQAKDLQIKLESSFGILLWEDLLQKMAGSGFLKGLLPFEEWAKTYADDVLKMDTLQHDS